MFLIATVERSVFVLSFPTIHGGDAAARIAGASELNLGYQLPLPQLFVAVVRSLFDDPIGVRLLFAAWGGVLTSGLAALVGLGAGQRAGMFAEVLVAFDLLLVRYSIVPYQEPLAASSPW